MNTNEAVYRCLIRRLSHRVVARRVSVHVDLAQVEYDATLRPIAPERVTVGVDQPSDVEGLSTGGCLVWTVTWLATKGKYLGHGKLMGTV